MMNKSFVLAFFLTGTILFGILSGNFSYGIWKSMQTVEAQLESQMEPEAAIQETYDALVAVGIKATLGRLSSTGEGYAVTYNDPTGKIAFIIFWTPTSGAHAVRGPIMEVYKSEGWHLSELGYPVTDEQGLDGVPGARYSEFENGVIAMLKGKYAQVFPTVEEAIAGLAVSAKAVGGQGASTQTGTGQGQGANSKPALPIVHKEKRFEVTFYAVNPVQCHDVDCTNDQVPDDDCAKWDMYGSVNGKMNVLMSSACMPGGLAYRDNPTKWYALSPSLVNRYSDLRVPAALFNNVQANQLGPFTVTVAVPDNGHFTIQTGGRERDRASDGDPSPFFDMVRSSNSKMQDYIRNKYIPTHPEAVDQKGNIDYDMALYDVVTGAELMNKIANNPAKAAAEFGNEAKNLLPELAGLSSEELNKYRMGVDIIKNVIQNPQEAVKQFGQEAINAAISEVGDQIPGPVGSFVSALDFNRLINEPGQYLKDTATSLAVEVAVAYGAQSIPGLGQAYAIGYALYKAFDFITSIKNPDDGIGIISEKCSAQNNFCVGTHAYKSEFNGIDSDSAGDFWMAINVKEI
jgi:LGFP repeat